jgi:hypothetical protein
MILGWGSRAVCSATVESCSDVGASEQTRPTACNTKAVWALWRSQNQRKHPRTHRTKPDNQRLAELHWQHYGTGRTIRANPRIRQTVPRLTHVPSQPPSRRQQKRKGEWTHPNPPDHARILARITANAERWAARIVPRRGITLRWWKARSRARSITPMGRHSGI